MPLVVGHSQTKYLGDLMCESDYSVFSYPGFSVSQFLQQPEIFEVSEYFTEIVLVVGANDIGRSRPDQIASNIERFCQKIHSHSPTARIFVSELLPRAQNEFPGYRHDLKYLSAWNRDANYVNRSLHDDVNKLDYVTVIEQCYFHTIYGARRSLMSRDGLHLSIDGNHELADTIRNEIEKYVNMGEQCYCQEEHKLTTPVKSIQEETNGPLVGGGNDIPVFSNTDRRLTFSEAADILIQNLPNSITKHVPYRPSAGSVYVYDDGGDAIKKEDWRADGYTWRNYGKHECIIGDGESKIWTCYFKLNNQGSVSSEFRKDVYRFVGEKYNNRTVIVYTGSEKSYECKPHGNRKKNRREYKRTKPSTMTLIKNVPNSEKPKDVFDKLKSEQSPNSRIQGVNVPKNVKQISNTKATMKKDSQLTHDALYSLHLLADQLEGPYIHTIKTHPDLQVIVANKELLDEFNNLLQISAITLDLFYDTTFSLGDFYVSTMAIQHPMFKETPVTPIAFMIHERKFESCHAEFISIIKTLVPKLSETSLNVVSDREKGIMNAFQERLPASQFFVCWNHIINDTKFWVKKHGGKSDDVKVYDMNIRELLKCETKDVLDKKYAELKLNWSEAFVTYFDTHLYETIVNNASRWLLENRGIYNPYSGITNNVSESLNASLKRLTHREEKRIDEFVLLLYYFQGNILSSLIESFCGDSEYTLLNQYSYARLDPDTVKLPRNVCPPEKMVDLIKGNLEKLLQCDDKKMPRSTDNDCQHLDQTSDSSNSDRFNERPSKKTIKTGLTSQHALASKIIQDGNIVLIAQFQEFIVKTTKTHSYAVKLFPESCTCPATSRCCHIMAAMKAIGMPLPEDKKQFKLVQLRKNQRPKNQRKCGTKKGRKGDVTLLETTIIPAPDSVKKTKQLDDISSDESFLNAPLYSASPLGKSTPKSASNTPLTESKRTQKTKERSASPFGKSTPKSASNTPLTSSKRTPKSKEKNTPHGNAPKTPKSILKTQHTPKTKQRKRKLQFEEDVGMIKIPRINSETPTLIDDQEILHLETSRDESVEKQETFHCPDWWLKELHLTTDDKKVIEENGKLNSNVMEAVNKLLRKQIGNSVHGLQLTERVPVFCESENMWKCKLPFEPINTSPACQIHHTTKDHWVVSLYYNGTIYLLDSLGNERDIDNIIPNGLKIQLCQLYGKNSSSTSVTVPSVSKQTNSVDCGLHAIAFTTAFCLRKNLCHDVIFDSKKFRKHLLSCLEEGVMTDFPQTDKTVGIRRRKHTIFVEIEQYCVCQMPDCYADMVQCEKNCMKWYHKVCVNAPSDVSTQCEEFWCGMC